MATNKNLFAGLIKIQGNQWSAYETAKENSIGKLIFADITTEGHVGKYIVANGIEYKVSADVDIDTLIQRIQDVSDGLNDLSTFIRNEVNDLSTYVHQTVDVSITNIKTSVSEVSTRLGEVSTRLDEVSTRLSNVGITASDNKLLVNNSSIAVEGDSYVKLTADGNKLSAGLDASALVKGTGDHITDVSLATKGYVDDLVGKLEAALEFKGDVATAAALDTIRETGSKGDVYVATAKFQYPADSEPATYIENGDLIILKEDGTQADPAEYIVVEKNDTDVVSTNDVDLTSGNLILGDGNHKIKVSSLTYDALLNHLMYHLMHHLM